jgi:hypothetical protein
VHVIIRLENTEGSITWSHLVSTNTFIVGARKSLELGFCEEHVGTEGEVGVAEVVALYVGERVTAVGNARVFSCATTDHTALINALLTIGQRVHVVHGINLLAD